MRPRSELAADIAADEAGWRRDHDAWRRNPHTRSVLDLVDLHYGGPDSPTALAGIGLPSEQLAAYALGAVAACRAILEFMQDEFHGLQAPAKEPAQDYRDPAVGSP